MHSNPTKETKVILLRREGQEGLNARKLHAHIPSK
jgi:hypothetical protein